VREGGADRVADFQLETAEGRVREGMPAFATLAPLGGAAWNRFLWPAGCGTQWQSNARRRGECDAERLPGEKGRTPPAKGRSFPLPSSKGHNMMRFFCALRRDVIRDDLKT